MAPVAGAMAQTQVKIGVVNVSRLLAGSAAGPGRIGRARDEFASRRRDLENQQKDLKTREEKLQKDGAVMAENERRNAEKALREGQRELARKQNEFLEDLNVRRNEALGQLQRAVVAGSPGLCEDRRLRHRRSRCAVRQPVRSTSPRRC